MARCSARACGPRPRAWRRRAPRNWRCKPTVTARPAARCLTSCGARTGLRLMTFARFATRCTGTGRRRSTRCAPRPMRRGRCTRPACRPATTAQRMPPWARSWVWCMTCQALPGCLRASTGRRARCCVDRAWCRVTDHLSVCAGHRSASQRCIACQYISVWAALCALRCAPMAARSLRHLIGDASPALMEKAPEPELDRPREQPPGARCAEVAPGLRPRRVLDDGGPGVDGLAGQHALVHAQIVARHALRAELLQHMRLAGAPVEAVVAHRLGQHGGPGR